jgi:hypothetical protein
MGKQSRRRRLRVDENQLGSGKVRRFHPGRLPEEQQVIFDAVHQFDADWFAAHPGVHMFQRDYGRGEHPEHHPALRYVTVIRFDEVTVSTLGDGEIVGRGNARRFGPDRADHVPFAELPPELRGK